MNYNETNELLERTVNAQKILATSPPTLPKKISKNPWQSHPIDV